MKIKIGQVVERLRRSRQLTQEELRFRAGITRKALGSIEKGESSPNVITLYKIAFGLQMEPVELMKEIQKDVPFRFYDEEIDP